MTALEHFSLDVMQCELYVPIFDSLWINSRNGI
jgi:hypothetical protein